MAANSQTGVTAGEHHPCPDPSAHEKSNKLSEQASTAALYVTHPERATEVRNMNPLGPDGKLSSKSAAASLKYAKPHELPSFPSHGHAADSAGKAAMQAKDYKMRELWQPELSSAGSKAALLAHGKGSKLDLWQPSASADGNSAAAIAMRNKGLGPQIFQGSTPDNKSRALLAATMSHNKGRQRADSTPVQVHPAYPDSHNSVANALNAATVSHRTSTMKAAPDGWNSEAMQAARVKNLHMDSSMFGEHPPVEAEVSEAKHNAALRASAVSMAKQMYDHQNRVATTSDPSGFAGAEAAAARNTTTPSPDLKQEAMRYINLQEAAHKLAAERLAKVDKDFENAKYREYYGYGNDDKSKRLSSRLSVRGRGRKRASSEGTATGDLDDSDDELQARKIRSQMSQLNSGLNSIDSKKQKDDRAKLLAAAEKRVSARMHDLDEKVFLQTGKVPPAMMEEWEEKARKRAADEREEKARNPGKTHIGGGKYMDQAEIEAIALARLKPTLEEINETAEKKRARDEELRLEKEEQERVKQNEKEKDKAQKAEWKKMRSDDKAAAKQEKEAAKAQKEEEKRAAKDEKRKSRAEVKDAAAAGTAGAVLGEVAEKVKSDDQEPTSVEGVQKHRAALDRLKNKFRRNKDGQDSNAKDIEDEEEEEREPATAHTGPAAATVAGGAVTGAAIEDVAHDSQPLDSQQAEHASTTAEQEKIHAVPTSQPATTSGVAAEVVPITNESFPAPAIEPAAATIVAADIVPTIDVEGHEEDDVVESLTPQRPGAILFEQQGGLSRYSNDAVPTLGPNRPDLERHISNIPEAGSDLSEEEDLEELGKEPIPAQGVAGTTTSGTAPTTSTTTTSKPAASGPVTNAPVAVAAAASEPVERVPGTKDASASLDSQRVEPVPTAAKPTVVGSGGSIEKKHYRAGSLTAPDVNNPANEYIRRTSKDIQDRPSNAELETGDGEKKGLRGFFSKLKHRQSKENPGRISEIKGSKDKGKENEMEKSSATEHSVAPTTAAAIGTGAGVGAAAAPTRQSEPDEAQKLHIGTDGQIGDPNRVSGVHGDPAATSVSPVSPIERNESISSFARGGVAPHDDLDDVSSSGADEDAVKQGRAGRLAAKLGLGGKKDRQVLHKKDHDDPRQSTTTETEDDDQQFEEARDTFDETAAPVPALAGSEKKSGVEGKGTKFVENL